MVLSLVTVERVTNVSPLARSRNTTALYSGWISVFMGVLRGMEGKLCGRRAKRRCYQESGGRASREPAVFAGRHDELEAEGVAEVLAGDDLEDRARQLHLAVGEQQGVGESGRDLLHVVRDH